MKIRKFNESKEVIDFNLLDKNITYIRECLLDFEDDERIKYLMHRVHFNDSVTGQKRGQQFGDYFSLSNYDGWLSTIKNDLDRSKNQEWFINQTIDNKPTLLLQCIIDIPTLEFQYPTEIKDIRDIESVMNSVEKLKFEFDEVSLFFDSDEVGRYGIPGQKAKIGVYFNLKS